MLFDGEIQYNMDARVLNFSMGKPRVQFNTSNIEGAEVKKSVEDPMEVEVAEGCTMAQFCDKIIDIFLNEKPKVKQWKKYLVLRDEWNKYSVNFYKRC
ncbi:unnamed protein product [Microthlaspi erraticum]|uniref:Uncharacterized protein n=1 Tax=Microthlaspi erraticum TaxID=1685480 RepID=A0A6D2J382_9BRAS|nr:unnamed protein product [Microthlaspi erraticum]